MNELSGSEWLFYGGISVMILTVVLAVLRIAIYILSGKKLKKKLEQEYGKPLC